MNKRKRLVMPRREESLPRDWLRNKENPFEAQIVSIHTGTICYSVAHCSSLLVCAFSKWQQDNQNAILKCSFL
jgi:hypothetical protein